MAVQVHEKDIIPHIDTRPDTLETKVSSTGGCVTLLGVLDLCYRVNGDSIEITVKLAGIEIGHGTLDASNPSVTIGGSVAGIGAEVTITFHVQQMSLEICGTVKYFIGSKHGCTTIHL